MIRIQAHFNNNNKKLYKNIFFKSREHFPCVIWFSYFLLNNLFLSLFRFKFIIFSIFVYNFFFSVLTNILKASIWLLPSSIYNIYYSGISFHTYCPVYEGQLLDIKVAIHIFAFPHLCRDLYISPTFNPSIGMVQSKGYKMK
jgi:hypothetical protein